MCITKNKLISNQHSALTVLTVLLTETCYFLWEHTYVSRTRFQSLLANQKQKFIESQNYPCFHTANLLLNIPTHVTMAILTALFKHNKMSLLCITKYSLWFYYNKGSPLAEVTPQNFLQLILLEVLKQQTQIEIIFLSSLNSSKLA